MVNLTCGYCVGAAHRTTVRHRDSALSAQAIFTKIRCQTRCDGIV